MSAPPETPNLNLRRRVLPGLLALAAAPFLRLLLLPLRKRPEPAAPAFVFASYMVGDLFMALPALKRLAAAARIRVICRPDCAGILEREGLSPVPFDNAFRAHPGRASFWATLRAAWKLRGGEIGIALDLDADPRTAFWLRIAGASRVVSYRRAYGFLFDETFPLPPDAAHQADRDMAVVGEFLRKHEGVGGRVGIHPSEGWGARWNPPFGKLETNTKGSSQPSRHGTTKNPQTSPAWDDKEPPNPHHSSLITHHSSPPWLLSVWTRKAAKNWPLERWGEFMERLREEGVPFAVLHAPDGDAEFLAFRDRWRNRAEFLEGPLEFIAERVKASAGVIATDNFLGHMAGYYGRPVLWINVASPADQVEPRGPRTVRVEADPREAGSLTVETVRPGGLEADAVWEAFAELRGARG